MILVGHGNAQHPADLAYAAAAHVFSRHDPLILVATAGGRPSLQDVLPTCRAARITRAYLMPFTTVAGRTFRDVAEESGKRSWTTALHDAGIQSLPVARALADVPGVPDVWLDQLGETLTGMCG